MKPICRRCGTYMDVLTNGYMCPNCKYQEMVISSYCTTPAPFKPVPIIDISQIRTHTDGEQIVWTREELKELIKETVKEMEEE